VGTGVRVPHEPRGHLEVYVVNGDLEGRNFTSGAELDRNGFHRANTVEEKGVGWGGLPCRKPGTITKERVCGERGR